MSHIATYYLRSLPNYKTAGLPNIAAYYLRSLPNYKTTGLIHRARAQVQWIVQRARWERTWDIPRSFVLSRY